VGCDYVAPKVSSKVLLDHWTAAVEGQHHGPLEDMLFRDTSSNTILNVKGESVCVCVTVLPMYAYRVPVPVLVSQI